MAKVAVPDVIVLLPGITGSVLAKDNKEIWAPRPGTVLRSLLHLRNTLETLELEDDDPTAPDLGDGVTATRLVDAVHIIPGLWKTDVYSAVEDFLLATFDLTQGVNYFPFPYDWRRDNRAAAHRLAERSRDWLTDWRSRSGNPNAQLVLVAHSMGGLVSRYFVEVLGGWQDTKAVITFGTPFYGSLNALSFLVNGYQKGIGPLQVDLSPVLQSCTSVHQLVPAYRCVYATDRTAGFPAAAQLKTLQPHWIDAWDAHRTEFQAEMDNAARENRKDTAFAANPVVYQPITGRDQPTLQSAVVVNGKLELRKFREGKDESGDGTVPLISAALSGTEEMRMFGPEKHARLQTSVPMLNHLSGVLQGMYATRIDDLRDRVTSWFGMSIDDVFLPGEPTAVELQMFSSLEEDLLSTVQTIIVVRDEATGQEVARRECMVPRTPRRFELPPQLPGSYRVEISGRSDTAPLSDVFTVASPTEAGG